MTRDQGLLANKKAIPPFAALRAFEAMGRLGGVRKAAAELSVDHAVVSRHLRLLEAWLGVTLFDRSGSVPQLTKEGQAYRDEVSAAMNRIAQATKALTDQRDDPALLIWCIPGLASKWLGAHLSAFRAKNPDVELQIRPTDGPPDFMQDGLVCDIRYYRDPIQKAAINIRRDEIARPVVFPVASPDWVRQHPAIQSTSELADVSLIFEESDEEWRLFLQALGRPVPERMQGTRLWHAHLAIDAAMRGEGLALANMFLVKDDLASGRLVAITLPDGSVPSATIGSYCFSARKDRMEFAGMRKLRSWLSAAAKSIDKDDGSAGSPRGVV